MFDLIPYTNFHELNLDWMIRVMKDFFNKYNDVQSLIDAGIVSINEATASDISELNAKYQELKTIIDETVAEYESDIQTILNNKISEFNTLATQKGLEVIETIPADYTELSDRVTTLQHEVEDGYNPIEINPDLVAGEAVQSTTGNFVSMSTFSRTNKIRLPDAAMMVIFKWISTSPTSLNALCFYDADQSYISGIATPLSDEDIEKKHLIPSNARYIAYSGSTTAFPNLKAEIGIRNVMGQVLELLPQKADLVTTFNEEYVKQQTLLQNVRGVKMFPNNLVNVEECENNAYIAWQTGTVYHQEPNYFCTGFIPVLPDTMYKANHGRNYAWYNSAKVYVGGDSGTAIQSGITSPANAAFIRFTVNKTEDGIQNPIDLYFAKFSDFNDTTVIPNVLTNPMYWTNGKRVNWLGDSIVAGYDFDDIVCAEMGLIQQYEYGLNASTISLNANGSDGRDAMCIRYANMTDDCDIVIVSGGTNDWMYAWAPIGDINSVANNTFYGAMKTLCEGLISKYPDKVILFTTPIKRAQPFTNGDGGTYTPDGVETTPNSKNKYGKTLGDYADIIKEVCGYYSIPVLDLYRESGLDPNIQQQKAYFDEIGTHPNETGRKIMARRVCGWLTQVSYNIN